MSPSKKTSEPKDGAPQGARKASKAAPKASKPKKATAAAAAEPAEVKAPPKRRRAAPKPAAAATKVAETATPRAEPTAPAPEAAAPKAPDQATGELVRDTLVATMKQAAARYLGGRGLPVHNAAGETDFSALSEHQLAEHGPGVLQAMFGALAEQAKTLLPRMAPGGAATTPSAPPAGPDVAGVSKVVRLRAVPDDKPAPAEAKPTAAPAEAAPPVAATPPPAAAAATPAAAGAPPAAPRPATVMERQIGDALRDAFRSFVAEKLTPPGGTAGPVTLGRQQFAEHGGTLVRGLFGALAKALLPPELGLGSVTTPPAGEAQPSDAAAGSPAADAAGTKAAAPVPIKLDVASFFEGLIGRRPEPKK